MEPIALKVGGFEVRSYGVWLAFSVLVVYVFALIDPYIKRLLGEKMEGLVVVATIGGILGARALYFIQNGFPASLSEFLWLKDGGLSGQGGVVGAVVFASFFLMYERIPLMKAYDTAAPYAAAVQGLGRFSCMLEGCCWGMRAPKWLPRIFTIEYSNPEAAGPTGVRFLHIQPLHAVTVLLFAVFLFWYRSRYGGRSVGSGKIVGLYLAGQGTIRALFDFLRGSRDLISGLPISWSQLISCSVAMLGIFLYLKGSRKVLMSENESKE